MCVLRIAFYYPISIRTYGLSSQKVNVLVRPHSEGETCDKRWNYYYGYAENDFSP